MLLWQDFLHKKAELLGLLPKEGKMYNNMEGNIFSAGYE